MAISSRFVASWGEAAGIAPRDGLESLRSRMGLVALRQKSVLMLPETARSSGAAGRDSLAEGGKMILCFWHRSV